MPLLAGSGSLGVIMLERRKGDRRHRLLAVLALLASIYCGLFVWPTPWRYDRVGKNPIRTHRVTDEVEFLNMQGWQPALPPLDVRRRVRARRAATQAPLPCVRSQSR